VRKVIVYLAASLDGYIAGPNGDMSFLDSVQQEGEDYGYFEFMKTVDTVVMGRKTYDWVMGQVPEFPHADKKTYIISRTERPQQGNLHFYSGNLRELITKLKTEAGLNIFVDGGAEIVQALLKQKLIDEIILSIIPILLGDGVKLFTDGLPTQALTLISSKTYESGLVQLHYSKHG
jgi:dihydrofolate reductase